MSEENKNQFLAPSAPNVSSSIGSSTVSEQLNDLSLKSSDSFGKNLKPQFIFPTYLKNKLKFLDSMYVQKYYVSMYPCIFKNPPEENSRVYDNC